MIFKLTATITKTTTTTNKLDADNFESSKSEKQQNCKELQEKQTSSLWMCFLVSTIIGFYITAEMTTRDRQALTLHWSKMGKMCVNWFDGMVLLKCLRKTNYWHVLICGLNNEKLLLLIYSIQYENNSLSHKFICVLFKSIHWRHLSGQQSRLETVSFKGNQNIWNTSKGIQWSLSAKP